MAASPRIHKKNDVDPSRKEAPSTSKPPLPPVDTLFVWDFDWTIVNCNSDEYVPSAFLGDDATDRRLRDLIRTHGSTRWHDCVAALVNSCMTIEQGGYSREDICGAAERMPYLIDVRESLGDVFAASVDSHSCGQAIISDGNDVFIGAFLERNGMERYFPHGIETNSGSWKEDIGPQQENGGNNDGEGGFRVVHQSTKYGGHTCQRCPPNLCKSQVLLDILGRIETGRRPNCIVYVGDGSNDACPAMNVLGDGDVLLARDGKRIGNPNIVSGPQADVLDVDELTGAGFPILETIERRREEDGSTLRCRICPWNSGKELRSLVRNILDNAAQNTL